MFNNSRKNFIIYFILSVSVLAFLIFAAVFFSNTVNDTSAEIRWDNPSIQISINILCSIFTGSSVTFAIMFIEKRSYKKYLSENIFYMVEQIINSGLFAFVKRDCSEVIVWIDLCEKEISALNRKNSKLKFIEFNTMCDSIRSLKKKCNDILEIINKQKTTKGHLSELLLLLINKKLNNNEINVDAIIYALDNEPRTSLQNYIHNEKSKKKKQFEKELDGMDTEDLVSEIRMLLEDKNDYDIQIDSEFDEVNKLSIEVKKSRDVLYKYYMKK